MVKKKINRREFDSVDLILDERKISDKEIATYLNIDYPLFCFKYLQDYSIDDCKDPKFFHDVFIRLNKLSLLGWKEIRRSNRHSFGVEKIPVSSIKPKAITNMISPEIKELDVFRAVGDNRPMIGFQEGKIFHVIFIEARFGDVYEH